MFRHLNSFLTRPCGRKKKKSFVHSFLNLLTGAGQKEKVRTGMFETIFGKLPAYLCVSNYYQTRSSKRIISTQKFVKLHFHSMHPVPGNFFFF